MQRREAADMIEMFMAGQDRADALGIEAQCADIGKDRGRRFGGCGIDQDRSGRRVDEQRGDATGADIISVAEQLCRRRGIAPAVAIGAGGGERLARRRGRRRGRSARLRRASGKHRGGKHQGGKGKTFSGHSWLHWHRGSRRSSTAALRARTSAPFRRFPPGSPRGPAGCRRAMCRRPGWRDNPRPCRSL